MLFEPLQGVAEYEKILLPAECSRGPRAPTRGEPSYFIGELMEIRIDEVRDRSDLRDFVRFSYSLYSNHRCWVPPFFSDELDLFRPKTNPAYEFCEVACWIARAGSEAVGRIAGIINHRSNQIHGEKRARFGWIDFIDDSRVSRALLSTVEDWAMAHGMDAVHGPLGFTDLDPEGMLVEGFDELGTIATIYNHEYYPAHMVKCGYSKDMDWVEFEVLVPEKMPERVARIAAIAQKRLNLTPLKVRKAKELLPFKEEVFSLLNESFSGLYGFVPLTEKQVEVYATKFFGYLNPKFVSIILDSDLRVAAFGITIPSLSRALQRCRGRLFPFGALHILRALRRNDTVDLYLIAVRHDVQGRGVNALILDQLGNTFREMGIQRAETNPELEHNLRVIRQWSEFDHRQHKRRRCFVKKLDQLSGVRGADPTVRQ